MNVIRSTLAGNSASNSGGGIYLGTGSLVITNSTLSGNSAAADGGGIINTGTATITNSTFAGNTDSGVAPDVYGNPAVTTTLINTIVTDGCFGTITDGGGNLDTGTSCGFGVSSFSGTNPMLSALADNGGPTQTMLPMLGSPAIDAIACTNAPATDQRGIARPQGSACDIGAVESNDRIFANGFE